MRKRRYNEQQMVKILPEADSAPMTTVPKGNNATDAGSAEHRHLPTSGGKLHE